MYSCAFSDDSGQRFVSGGGDGTLMVWDTDTKRCSSRYAGAHGDKAINSLGFFGPEKLWSQGRDGFIKQWDLQTEQCVSAHDIGCHSFVSMSRLVVKKEEGLAEEPICFAAVPDSEDMKGVVLLRLDARAKDVSVVKQWAGNPKHGMCMRLNLLNSASKVVCGYESGHVVIHEEHDETQVVDTSIQFPITALAIDEETGLGCLGGAETTLLPFKMR